MSNTNAAVTALAHDSNPVAPAEGHAAASLTNADAQGMETGVDRRVLLSGLGAVAGVAAIASLTRSAGAGPLTPPAGAVASTGRTVDEIYNKVNTLPGARDLRTVIPGGSTPFTINAAGSYVLGGDLTGANPMLIVDADNVTVDLNGFSIRTTNINANCVTIGDRKEVEVRNGTIVGGQSGLRAGLVNNLRLIDLTVVRCRYTGIFIDNPSARSVIVRRCTVVDSGASTVAADFSQPTIGAIVLGGNSHRVEECSVSRFFHNGTGVAPAFRGVWFATAGSSGNIAARCMISHDLGILVAIGIRFEGVGVFRDNTILNLNTPSSGGTNGGGNA